MDRSKIPLTRLTHHLITQHFAHLGCRMRQAIDATCGNGFDTVFLASLGFKSILAFDVQEHAILSTKTRLANMTDKINPDAVKLIHQGHENMAQHITQPIDCAIFNLGFLPKADKQITTHAETTLTALRVVQTFLAELGMFTILCYPGHSSGAHETKAVQQWLSNLDDQWIIKTHLSQAPSYTTPVLYYVKRN